MQQRNQNHLLYNATEFAHNSNTFNKTINYLPNVYGGALMVYLWFRLIIIDPIVFYLNNIGIIVQSFQKVWFGCSKRKPPDPNVLIGRHRRRLKKQLLYALPLMNTNPNIILSSDARHISDMGLVSTEDPSPIITSEKAKELRELIEESTKIANIISSKGKLSVQACLEAVNASQELSLSEGLRLERRLFHSLFATSDQKEGMNAFLEKRKPNFKK